MDRAGIVPRIMQSWWAPGRVVASLRGTPERVLIVILMAAMLIFLIAQAPGHTRAAHLDPSVPFEARMGGALLAVAPAMLLAGLVEGFVGPGAALSLVRVVAGFGFLVIWGAGLRVLAGKR